MSYVWQRWLADEMRAAGLSVIEVEGWQNRGRPASTGSFNPRGATTVHHVGARTSQSNPAAGLQLLITGRSDLPGPLAQIATDYNGNVYIIAAGRANHAGRIGKPGVVGMPLGGDGNEHSIGNEVMTDGTQKMPKAQEEAIALAAAVITLHNARNSTWAHRHEDISPTGKWDLGQWTTAELRRRVANAQNFVAKKKTTLPVRVRVVRAQLLAEIKRIKRARAVAKKKGEPIEKYDAAIVALTNARKRLGEVPKR